MSNIAIDGRFFLTTSILLWRVMMYTREKKLGMGTHVA